METTATVAERQVPIGSSDAGRIWLSVGLSRPLYEVLQTLAAETNSSEAEVMRRALALMQVAVEGRKKGQKVGLAGSNQELEEEITGLGI